MWAPRGELDRHTLLLDSARRLSPAPRKGTADLCSPQYRSIPSTCSPPPASPANQPALHAHLVGNLTMNTEEDDEGNESIMVGRVASENVFQVRLNELFAA
ncbi:hypothetical protein B2J88_49595, partial [Rhodococcus sp. SRB_17]|nr:hypothetical protein [Rhodococcus sp. SRB_17]NMM92212.1 hypothetical protein [Rhodococcus sp. SRB_17]